MRWQILPGLFFYLFSALGIQGGIHLCRNHVVKRSFYAPSLSCSKADLKVVCRHYHDPKISNSFEKHCCDSYFFHVHLDSHFVSDSKIQFSFNFSYYPFYSYSLLFNHNTFSLFSLKVFHPPNLLLSHQKKTRSVIPLRC